MVILIHNSYAGKLYQFRTIIIVVSTETKLDDNYPDSQFYIDGFSKPYKMNRNRYGGGVLIYIYQRSILSKELYKHNFTTDIEGMFIKINFKKTKGLLFDTKHPPIDSESEYFEPNRACFGFFIRRRFQWIRVLMVSALDFYPGEQIEMFINFKCSFRMRPLESLHA